MRKFEYKVFDIDTVKQSEEEFINKMGSEGWELVQIHNEPMDKSPLILVKLYFHSSQSCACESSEIYYLTKNLIGDFIVNINNSESDYIQANLLKGKVTSIIIKSQSYEPCCNIPSGIFLIKPTPPSGSSTTPKLQSLIVVPERFLIYWNNQILS